MEPIKKSEIFRHWFERNSQQQGSNKWSNKIAHLAKTTTNDKNKATLPSLWPGRDQVNTKPQIFSP